MTERGNWYGIHIITSAASPRIIAFFRTGGRFTAPGDHPHIMAERGDRLRLAAQFVAANGAVNDFVVRTRNGARRFFLVLAHGLTFGVAECRTFVCSRISCFAAVALRSFRAVLGARCVIIRNIVRKAMIERRNFIIRITVTTPTSSAVIISIPLRRTRRTNNA